MIRKDIEKQYQNKDFGSVMSSFVSALKKWGEMFFKLASSKDEAKLGEEIDKEEAEEDKTRDISHIEDIASERDIAKDINEIFGFDVDEFLSMGIDKISADTMDIYKRVHETPYEKTMDFVKSAAKYNVQYNDEDLQKIYELHKNIGGLQANYDEILTKQVGITGSVGATLKKAKRKFINEVTKPIPIGGFTGDLMDAIRKDIENSSNQERKQVRDTSYKLQRQGE